MARACGVDDVVTLRPVLACVSLVVSLAACSHAEHSAETASRAVSPLSGRWEINADTAGKSPRRDYPQFTALRFEDGGTLDASYAASPAGLGAITGASATTKDETDHWSVSSGKTLRIVEGSRELKYAYEVRDRELLLTANGTDTPVVYARAAGD